MNYPLCLTFLAVLAIEQDHQHGDVSFHGAYEQDEFGLNSEPFDQQQEIEQMISFHGAYEQDEFDLNSEPFDQQQEIEQMIGKLSQTFSAIIIMKHSAFTYKSVPLVQELTK
jgi:hypothetical protein